MNHHQAPRPLNEDGRALPPPPDSTELNLGYEAAYPFLAMAQFSDDGDAVPAYRPA